MLDQLGPGTLVGEMEFLTGRELTTTIRAATDVVLLKLTAPDIAQLLTLEPRLAQELWLSVCGRVLRRSCGRFQHWSSYREPSRKPGSPPRASCTCRRSGARAAQKRARWFSRKAVCTYNAAPST